MNLIHSYKREATDNSLVSLIKQFVIRFINEHPDVFEALSRSGSPFGGNCFPVRQYAADLDSVAVTRKEIARVQSQLEALTDQVARLNDRIDSAQTPAKSESAPEKQIGINRFRALQAQSHSLA